MVPYRYSNSGYGDGNYSSGNYSTVTGTNNGYPMCVDSSDGVIIQRNLRNRDYLYAFIYTLICKHLRHLRWRKPTHQYITAPAFVPKICSY